MWDFIDQTDYDSKAYVELILSASSDLSFCRLKMSEKPQVHDWLRASVLLLAISPP